MKYTSDEVPLIITARRMGWERAVEMVEPIIDKYGVEDYYIGPVGIFSSAIRTTSTKVDQNIDHILRVADWLLEPVTR